jgi:hypothetical protein
MSAGRLDREERDECVLCKYAGGSNAEINDVMKYIHDNISKLSLDEIAKQVQQELPRYLTPGETCSHASIVEHIQNHSQEHNIVICTLLRDVRALSQELLQSSRVRRESDTHEIDLKAASMFFKSVELAAMLSAKIHDK